MRLVIDTSKKKISIWLNDDSGKTIASKKWPSSHNESLVLLFNIDKMLRSIGKSVDDVDSIYVNRGPGSYTSLRVGLSIANGLAFSKDIPIYAMSSQVGKESRFSKVITPKYLREAHITKKRTRPKA